MSQGLCPRRLELLTQTLDGLADGVCYAGVVTRVWHRNELVHEDCLGAMDLAGAVPMRRDAIFRIASMTKPIVSVAVLQLVEEGKIRLGDEVTRWLPELADRKVLRTPTSSIDDVVPAVRPLTVLDLLTHRSGIPYEFNSFGDLNRAIAVFHGNGISADLAPDAWMQAMAEAPLIAQPGAVWHYGFSTDVLGVLLARIDGQPLPNVLKTRIFAPLGMVDTDFHVPREKLDRFTVGYTRDSAGRLAVHDDPQDSRFGQPRLFPGGGGGLVSTADDYSRFALALVNGGTYDGARVLGRKTVEAMTRDWLTDAQRRPLFPKIDFLAPHGFGLGVSVVRADGVDNALATPGKFGWPGAYTTRWFADRSEALVGVMMTQMWFDMERRIGPAFDSLVYQGLV